MNTTAYEKILTLMRTLKQDLDYEDCLRLSARFDQLRIDKKKQERRNDLENYTPTSANALAAPASSEQLRAIIVKRTLEYAAKFKVSEYNALCDISSLVFKFMCGWVKNDDTVIRTNYNDYRNRFFDFVLGDHSALTDTELYYAKLHYNNTPETNTPAADILEELKEAVTEHRAEIKRITDSTAEMRRILRRTKIDPVFERINDFVRYDELVHSDGATLFYVELYELGRIDGIRQERSRRRRSAQV